MNILWFSWKDINHPSAGGAETVSNNIMKRLVRDGHSVRLITSLYPGASNKEIIDGIEIYRSGSRLTVYWHAFRYFKKHLKSWPDLVIDEMNTVPFGCAFYVKKPSILLTYQLARKVWFYQMPFPLSILGYTLEPFYLFLLSRKYKTVLTESESTRQDMRKYGFSSKKVHVFRIGMALDPLKKLDQKSDLTTILSLGAIRPMKRTMHIIKAFEHARMTNHNLKLIVAGDASTHYGRKVVQYIESSRQKDAITFLGKVTNEKRLELMRSSTMIIVTSIKEGWGLIITEANSQGTPAVAYNTDGLKDSIKNGLTGILVRNGSIQHLSKGILRLHEDSTRYNTLRKAAWSMSKDYTFENSYKDFISILGISAP